ncbi:uncharacterized protein [Leuresthes tenuis]|uniref:uncharacterized protein n=1 Tax=Leuresthes tenuis TaxID=355514 RepID=UPI003B500053
MMSKEFIHKNAIIDKGPPVRYQLRLKVENLDGPEEESRLRRCTLGEKVPGKPNKTILLVGETGSGKSALINTFVNFAMGVKKGDNEWFEIVDDTETERSGSVTSKVSVYEIFGLEGKTLPYSLTIIDTPGYGDTRGVEFDCLITQKLYDLFRSEDGVHEVHAVGLVLKAADNRLSDRLMYIYDSVMSLFGKDVEGKIVALITHSDGMPPKTALKALQDANTKCAKTEKDQPVYFVFNNCLNTPITEETEFGLEQAWMVTTRGMKNFTAFLEKSTPQKLQTTVIVLNERIRLEACVNNLADRVKTIKLKQAEIDQTQEILETHKEKLRTGESFTLEVDEPYKEKEAIDGGMWLFWFGGAVTCSVCEENCHYPGCTMAWKPSLCEVMKGGRCTACTKKCPAEKHVKEKWRYVTKTRKVKKTIEEVKQTYQTGQKQSESLLKKLQSEKENLEKEKNRWLDEAYQHVVKLEQIALSVDSVFTFIPLDFLIEMMKERRDTEKVLKLEEIKNKVDKGVLANLRERFKNFGAKPMK